MLVDPVFDETNRSIEQAIRVGMWDFAGETTRRMVQAAERSEAMKKKLLETQE